MLDDKTMDIQATFSNSADDTKVGGMWTVIEHNPGVSNDGDSLEHGAKANRMKRDEDKWKLFKNVPRTCFN